MVLLFTVALAGCSDNQAAEPAPTADPSQKPTESEPIKENQAVDKYDPSIELSTVMFSFNYPKFAEGDDVNNNRWTRYIQENLGIKINTLWDVAHAQYQQKVNLMIASGELPDFFAVTPAQFIQLHNAGLIEDLTDSYEKFAPAGVKQVMKDAGAEVFESAKIDGKLMAIPWTGEAQAYVPVMWIRKDWMDKLNLSPPQSMEDVIRIAEAFTTQDPNGNNKDDTHGLALDKDNYFMTGFLNGFHAYKGIWIEDGAGGLTYGSVQPEMKAALAKLQEMYKAKQIDPEFVVNDFNKMNETIGAGKLGILMGDISSSNTLATLTPETEWLPFPVPSIDGQPALMQHPLNIFNYYWVVKKGVEHPEAVYKLLQVWLDLFYDNTSDDVYAEYNATTDTGFWLNSPIKVYKTFKDVDIYRHLKPILESGNKDNADLSKLTPEERDFYKQILAYEQGDVSFRGSYWKAGPNSSGKVIDGYIQNNQFKPDKFTAAPTDAMIQKLPNLQKMEEQMISKIITGSSLDEFDKFVEQWKALGGEEITKEVNEWYKGK